MKSTPPMVVTFSGQHRPSHSDTPIGENDPDFDFAVSANDHWEIINMTMAISCFMSGAFDWQWSSIPEGMSMKS